MLGRYVQGDSGGLFLARAYVAFMIATNKTAILFLAMLVWAAFIRL